MQGRIFCRPKNKAQWLAARRLGITGTDIAALCGESPFKTPLGVYIDKVSPLEVEENQAMMLGTYLEDPIAKLWAKENKAKIKKVSHIIQHPEHELVLANIDRHVLSPHEAILECKNVGPYSMKRWDDEQIPTEYYLQLMWYLFATGIKVGHFAALVGGTKYVERTIEYDHDLAMDLFSIATRFWNDHVVPRIPPAMDGSERTSEWLKSIYPRADGTTIEIQDAKLQEFIELRVQADAEMKAAEVKKKAAEQEIQDMMMEHERIIVPGVAKVNWPNQTMNKFDSDRFKLEHPDLYAQYVEKKEFRRFTITLLKGDS